MPALSSQSPVPRRFRLLVAPIDLLLLVKLGLRAQRDACGNRDLEQVYAAAKHHDADEADDRSRNNVRIAAEQIEKCQQHQTQAQENETPAGEFTAQVEDHRISPCKLEKTI